MVQLSTLLFALAAAGSVTAAPAHLNKRIAQVIADSTTKWEAACVGTVLGSTLGVMLTYLVTRTPLEVARNAIKYLSPPLVLFSLVQARATSRTMPIS